MSPPQRQLLRVLNGSGQATTDGELDGLLRRIGAGKAATTAAADADAELFTFSDTLALVKTRRLQQAFRTMDTDHDGTLDAGELQAFLQEEGLSVSPQQVQAMLDAVDRDADGTVDFADFHRMFLAHADDLSKLGSVWMALASVDTGSDFSAVPPPKSVPLWRFVLAGGMGGVVSRTLTAPLERIKILAQTSAEGSATHGKGMRALVGEVVAKEGVRGLWAGNGANVVRVFPFGGLVCLCYSRFINWFPTDAEFDLMEPFYRGVAGALAGAIATSATYPLDVIKARLSGANRAAYGGSIRTALSTIVAQEGPAALFRGYAPTVLAIAPFLALQQSSYDVMKQLAGEQLGLPPSIGLFIGLGACAGVFAQSVIHPVDVVRRRMQMASTGVGGGTFIGQLREAFGRGLARGAFAGWGAATAKVAPAVAISLTVRDALLGRHKQ